MIDTEIDTEKIAEQAKERISEAITPGMSKEEAINLQASIITDEIEKEKLKAESKKYLEEKLNEVRALEEEGETYKLNDN